MIILSPIVLIIFGLVMNLFGALFISIEALGAKELLGSMTNDNRTTSRKTEIGFTATINQIFIFILVWILCIIISIFFIPEFNMTLKFLIAPLGYVVWQLLVKLSEFLYDSVKPRKFRKYLSKKRNVIVRIIQFLLVPFWVIIIGVFGLLRIFVRFVVELPLCWVSEKVIRKGIINIYNKIAKAEEDMQKWHFKKVAFIGALLLIGGFMYQILGTVLLLFMERQ